MEVCHEQRRLDLPALPEGACADGQGLRMHRVARCHWPRAVYVAGLAFDQNTHATLWLYGTVRECRLSASRDRHMWTGDCHDSGPGMNFPHARIYGTVMALTVVIVLIGAFAR